VQDIADFLKSGTDKCFNEPEGMIQVIASTSQMSDEDVTAIATYIHALPPKPGNGKHKSC
jgi:cytochrome c553